MAFLEQAKTYPSRTLKTVLCCLAYTVVGVFTAICGPTLLDLQILTNTSIEEIALLLPARSAGYAVGTVVVGIIGDYLNSQIITAISLLLSCLTLAPFGFITSIKLMYAIIFVGGMASGSIDTISNVWIIHLWGKENPPFIQLVHFFFGLGAFIAPFVTEPFLMKTNDQVEITMNNTFNKNATVIEDYNLNDLKIHWPYIIVSIYSLIVFLAFLINYIKDPSNDPHPSRNLDLSENQKNEDKWSLNKPVENKTKIFVIALATLFIHSYVGLEISFGSLLATFAVKSNLKLSKSDGSFLSGVYWGAYTFFPVISVFLIDIISPLYLITVCLSIIMLSNGILLPFGNNYEWALWVGSTIMGLGCSPIFGTMFTFTEQFTPVTSKITAGFMVSACVGEFIIPYVVGSYIETNPKVFLYVVSIYSLLSFLFFFSLVCILLFLLKKQKKGQKIEVSCINK